MKKLEKMLNLIREEQIKEDLLMNEEDFNLGYIPYRAYVQNRNVLISELKNLKEVKEVKTC